MGRKIRIPKGALGDPPPEVKGALKILQNNREFNTFMKWVEEQKELQEMKNTYIEEEVPLRMGQGRCQFADALILTRDRAVNGG